MTDFKAPVCDGLNGRLLFFVAPILDEIRRKNHHLLFFRFNMEANIVADACVKLACTLDLSDCWLSESLIFLVQGVMADL